MIEVIHLRKVYGDTVAVDDVSFEVPAGEVLGFLGPNGAGKTSTMRVLTGYTPATSGRTLIGGFDVRLESRRVRAILGYLPENAPVYGEMTVRAFVDFFAGVKGLNGSERRRAVGQALDECGLEEVAGRVLMNLSKGYRQRAALAQAVVGDPRVLILDEPTVGLDPRQVRGVRKLIRRMAERRTVVLSTHILPEVSLTCTRVVIIHRGKVVASGTPENIGGAAGARHEAILTVRGPRKRVEQTLGAVSGVERVDCQPRAGAGSADDVREYLIAAREGLDARNELARAVVEAGWDLLELRSTGMSLEEVFLRTVASGEAETSGGPDTSEPAGGNRDR